MRRADAARLALLVLLACFGLSLTAGASSAFATYGTIKVHKVNVGGDLGQKFSFDGYWRKAGSSSLAHYPFSLYGVAPGSANTTGNTYSASVLYNTGYGAPDYTVTENVPDGYELTAATCTYPQGKSTGMHADRTGNSVAFKVGVDKTVECTFTNTRKTGTITLKKALLPANDAGRFDLRLGDAVVVPGATNGSYATKTVPTGTYAIGEAAVAPASDADYVESVACKDGYGAPVAIQYGKVAVGKGDDITCTFTNTRKAKIVVEKHTVGPDGTTPVADETTLFDFSVSTAGAEGAFDTFQLKNGGQHTTAALEPGKAYTVSEAGDPQPLGYKLVDVECRKGDPAVRTGDPNESDRTATVTPVAGDVITCEFTNQRLNPAVDIVKQGPATAYSGDTLNFTFLVSIPGAGQLPLHDVKVADDHCPNVVGPVGGDTNGNQILELGETWKYTCSMVATNVMGVDANPVTNVATVTAVDKFGDEVNAQDTHDTLFLHPAIDIAKTGPATAVAGSQVTYTLDVRNPGDRPFSMGDVVVTDAKCSAAPVRTSVNGDSTDASLDPGDRWTYTCSVQTQVGETSVVNVADVKGTDAGGKVVTDEDTFTTTLTHPTPAPTPTPTGPAAQTGVAPAQQVAGVTTTSRARPGSARLRGPSACARTRTFSATVTGSQIRRVTFFVGGKKVRTVTKADRNGRWTVSLRTSSLRPGANTVRAQVVFTTASKTKARTLRISVTNCAARSVSPQFTG